MNGGIDSFSLQRGYYLDMPVLVPPLLDAADRSVLEAIAHLHGQLALFVRQPRRWTGLVSKVLLARSIRGSNSIEGFEVTLDDAVAAIDEDEPASADPTSWAAVRGYRDAMTYVLQLAHDDHFVLTPELIKSLHFMMQQYDLQKWPGRWRPGDIYVFDEDTGRVVYTGPDADLVPGLVGDLVSSLNTGGSDVPPLVRAAMAHLNLVLIHPFKDGNGRMARCLQALVLAREGLVSPEFCSIEEYLGRNQRAYYDVLTEVAQGRWDPAADSTPWVRFCLTAHYRQALTVRRRTREAERIWVLAERATEAKELVARTTSGVFYAMLGRRLRNTTYRQAVDGDISAALASKDLGQLVAAGVLVAHGERRGRWYAPSAELAGEARRVRAELREQFPTDANPYDLQSEEIEGQETLFR